MSWWTRIPPVGKGLLVNNDVLLQNQQGIPLQHDD